MCYELSRQAAWKSAHGQMLRQCEEKPFVRLFFLLALMALGVGGLPGITYGPESDRHMRLSFSVDRSEIEKAVQRLEVLKSM